MLNNNSQAKFSIYALPLIIILMFPFLNFFFDINSSASTKLIFQEKFLETKIDLFFSFIKFLNYLFSVLLFVKVFHYLKYVLINNLYLFSLALYMLISIAWTQYPLKIIINLFHYIGLLFSIFSFSIFIQNRTERVFLVISAVTFIYIIFSIPISLWIPASLGIDGRWSGLAGHPNTLGTICFLSIWSNISYLLIAQKYSKIYYYFALVLSCCVLLMTNSVTSILISLFIILFSFLYYIIISNNFFNAVFKFFLFFLFLLLASLILYYYYENYFSYDGLFALLGRTDNFTGRSMLWKSALDLINKKFWFGWSFDSNASVARNLFGYMQFHNGYLDFAVRGGIVGLSVLLLLILFLFIRILKCCRYDSKIGFSFLILFCSILIHNIVEASYARETHILWIMFLVLYVFSDYMSRRLIYENIT